MRELLMAGGPVLWVILVCGAAALCVFVERGFHLHRARIRTDDLLAGILNILKGGNAEEAVAICDETPGPVARIVRTAIQHRREGRPNLEAAMHDAGLVEIARLEARIGILATIAQIAPLLGLLGTILGMMTLLDSLQGSNWQSAAITAGVRQALVTAAAGLVVAIPCYAAFNLVVAKIERLVVDMERASLEIVSFLTATHDNVG